MERYLLIHPHELDDTWLAQAAALGLDGLGLHPVGGRMAAQALDALLRMMDTAPYRRLADSAEKQGIRLHVEAHALRFLLPEDVLRAHPHWQRVGQDGQRTTHMNLCPSCGEALDYLTERTAWLYARLPAGSALWLDDGADAFCHCPRCRGISPSDQQLILLEAMLRGARQVRPDAELPYLAYFETTPAPTRRDLAGGLYLEFAPYTRDLAHPLAHPANADAARHVDDLMRFFGWEHATALDYWFDNSLFSHYTKPPARLDVRADVVRADAAYYAAKGFARLSGFACYLGADYRSLYGLPDLSSFQAINRA